MVRGNRSIWKCSDSVREFSPSTLRRRDVGHQGYPTLPHQIVSCTQATPQMFHGQSPIREELPGAELKIRKLLFMADMAITGENRQCLGWFKTTIAALP